MGIQDREYYRSVTRGSAWFSGVAPACRMIIVINVIVFLVDKIFFNGNLTDRFGANRVDILEKFQIWRLLTAAFLHDPDQIFHLAFNMIFLWMVGREMEAFHGTRNFTAFYLSAAVFSSICWVLVDAVQGGRPTPFGPADNVYMVGASGAVMAVVVLYTLYYPTREVLLFFAIPIEMRWLLTIYIGFDLFQLLTGSGAPVAFAAHLGGALFGWLYKKFDLRISRLAAGWPKRRPRIRIYDGDSPTREVRFTPRTPPPSSAASAPAASSPSWTGGASTAAARPAPKIVTEEELAERLDEILGKIARDGRGSLTDEEQRFLEEASHRARNRRSDRL
ncbi:MAG: rhomboid family intramembrane serine protease [Isosphaeraceae bacterium]|nr:rhomboid family intramembrane serine protease [Isosphaeraceae bacterium]